MLPSESHTKIMEGRTDTHLVMLDFLQTHRDNRDHDTLASRIPNNTALYDAP